MLPPGYHDDWPERIREAVPAAEVKVFPDPKNAFQDIEEADCAYGYVPPHLFARAKRLRWIQCYAAGPDPSFYHEALVRSDVVVTNFRGIYNDNVSHHALTLLLALSRHLHRYMPQQLNVGRGVCVVLDDLLQALRSGKIAGAALDVFEVEPLPVEHPLWKMPNVLITPHIAAHKAPYLAERRTRILIGNCQRFARGEPLVNVVDKGSRF